MTIEDIAKVCHEANRAYCCFLGDNSQKIWQEAEQWQRDSAIGGVQFRLRNPRVPVSSQHESWLRAKLSDGWKYGPVKDASMKEHPCVVPYDELPREQQVKDSLFVAIVDVLKSTLDSE